MSGASSIEWTDATWNPVRGCSRVSEGCRNCYAERHAARFSDEGVEMNDVDGHMHGALPFAGFAKNTPAGPRWTGEVALMPGALDWPLRKKKPLRIFVNSMSDLFHERLSNEAIAAVFGVMAACPQHTFQVLTKRPERMRDWFTWLAVAAGDTDLALPCSREAQRIVGSKYPLHEIKGTFLRYPWPLPNVWLGVSVENQATADERILRLLQTPAAKRSVSYEPALGPVDFESWLGAHCRRCRKLTWKCLCEFTGRSDAEMDARAERATRGGLDWIIVGGESGPGARPFDIAWARSTVAQCKAAGVAVFVKQLGARPIDSVSGENLHTRWTDINGERIRHPKGGDCNEWPEYLRVQEFPR